MGSKNRIPTHFQWLKQKTQVKNSYQILFRTPGLNFFFIIIEQLTYILVSILFCLYCYFNMQMQGQKKHKSGRWSQKEHTKFQEHYYRLGKDCKATAQIIETRTETQVRSHAQKYEKKMEKQGTQRADILLLRQAQARGQIGAITTRRRRRTNLNPQAPNAANQIPVAPNPRRIRRTTNRPAQRQRQRQNLPVPPAEHQIVAPQQRLNRITTYNQVIMPIPLNNHVNNQQNRSQTNTTQVQANQPQANTQIQGQRAQE